MICEHCRKAGQLNWLLNTGTAGEELSVSLTKKMEEYYSECPGGTHCDSQKRPGKWVESPKPLRRK